MGVRPDIELHIEELVLHGYSPHDRWRIADAVRAELEARFALGQSGYSRDVTIDRLDAGTIALEPGAAGGRAIGGAIHSAIGGDDAPASAVRAR